MGKKKYLFQVCLELVELSNVALSNEFIFVKIRQKNGGKLNYLSGKSEVRSHRVIWNERVNFQCKTQASASTGILNECYLRFSIRKETRLGGTYKLGFVDVNLSEFAGCGRQSGKCLLEGYSSMTRLDNSILKFFIDMQLISGDPLFKRHSNMSGGTGLLVETQRSSIPSQLPPYAPATIATTTTPALHTTTTTTTTTTPPITGNFDNKHYLSLDSARHSLILKTPFSTDESKFTDSTRVNNDLAVNEIIEQNLRYASSLPGNHKGLSLHDIQ